MMTFAELLKTQSFGKGCQIIRRAKFYKYGNDILVCEFLFSEVVHVHVFSTNVGLEVKWLLGYGQGVGRNGHNQRTKPVAEKIILIL